MQSDTQGALSSPPVARGEQPSLQIGRQQPCTAWSGPGHGRRLYDVYFAHRDDILVNLGRIEPYRRTLRREAEGDAVAARRGRSTRFAVDRFLQESPDCAGRLTMAGGLTREHPQAYLTLLQAEPEPGTAAHICWIALMSDAFDVLSPLERDAAVGWMASQTEGARQ